MNDKTNTTTEARDKAIEAANKFIAQDTNGLRKACLEIPINIDWLAGKFADFAEQTADIASSPAVPSDNRSSWWSETEDAMSDLEGRPNRNPLRLGSADSTGGE